MYNVEYKRYLLLIRGMSQNFMRPGGVNVETAARDVLERELRQFVSDVALSEEERRHQAALVQKVERLAKSCLHETAQVLVFGSSASGLCEKSSDVDATIKIDFAYLAQKFHGTYANVAPSETRSLCAQAISSLAEFVERINKEEEQVTGDDLKFTIKNCISTAKVPILILASHLGHTIDVSINNELPLYNTTLLRTYAQIDERVRILVLCVKRWARLAGVTDAKSCNLSSYSWVLLCVYYLQVRPEITEVDPRTRLPLTKQPIVEPLLVSLQEMAMKTPEAIFRDPSSGREFDVRAAMPDTVAKLVNYCSKLSASCKASASDLLKGFFTFYANHFQWGTEVVSVRCAHRVSINHAKFSLLARGKFALAASSIHIEDPFDLQRNLNCVLDEAGLARLKHAFVDVDRRVQGDVSYVMLLNQARLLFYGRQVVPSRGWYIETNSDGGGPERRVDLW